MPKRREATSSEATTAFDASPEWVMGALASHSRVRHSGPARVQDCARGTALHAVERRVQVLAGYAGQRRGAHAWRVRASCSGEYLCLTTPSGHSHALCVAAMLKEYAGLGGDVHFVRGQLDVQVAAALMPTLFGVPGPVREKQAASRLSAHPCSHWCARYCQALSLSGTVGSVVPLGEDRQRGTRIVDRLFLGGPTLLRGFAERGAGPRASATGACPCAHVTRGAPSDGGSVGYRTAAGVPGGDALGGDVRAVATAVLHFPLPLGWLSEYLRGHVFATAGNLVPFHDGAMLAAAPLALPRLRLAAAASQAHAPHHPGRRWRGRGAHCVPPHARRVLSVTHAVRRSSWWFPSWVAWSSTFVTPWRSNRATGQSGCSGASALASRDGCVHAVVGWPACAASPVCHSGSPQEARVRGCRRDSGCMPRPTCAPPQSDRALPHKQWHHDPQCGPHSSSCCTCVASAR